MHEHANGASHTKLFGSICRAICILWILIMWLTVILKNGMLLALINNENVLFGFAMLLVMLVDDDLARADPLKQSLTNAGYKVIAHLSTTENLDVAVREMQPDIVIIDTDSPSRDTLENLCVMNETVPKPIVMFTHDGDIQKMREATKVGVSAYVVGNLASDSLMPVINAAIVRFEEVKLLRDELDQTKLKLAERKVVEKAKGLLMKEHSFDEDHAYAMLRSMAMGQSKRIAVLASEVIEAATKPL